MELQDSMPLFTSALTGLGARYVGWKMFGFVRADKCDEEDEWDGYPESSLHYNLELSNIQYWKLIDSQ